MCTRAKLGQVDRQVVTVALLVVERIRIGIIGVNSDFVRVPVGIVVLLNGIHPDTSLFVKVAVFVDLDEGRLFLWLPAHLDIEVMAGIRHYDDKVVYVLMEIGRKKVVIVRGQMR